MTLTDYQIDALTEMINIGVGHASGILNTMLRSHIVLRVPVVEILSPEKLAEHKLALDKDMISAVRLGFKGPFTGNASMIFPTESAVKLVILLTEEDEESSALDPIMIGTLTEVGNIVLNGVMGAIGNELQERIFYSVPTYVDNPGDILGSSSPSPSEIIGIWVQTRFSIEEHQIDGDIVIIFEVGSLDLLLAAIERKMGE